MYPIMKRTVIVFLKACKNLLPETEIQYNIFEKTFRDCCNKGHVNKEVLRRLAQCLRSEDLSRILCVPFRNKRDIEGMDIPYKWGRNVTR